MGKVSILMSIDEQETDSVAPRCRRETSQQQGAIAADNQRGMTVAQDRCDCFPDPRHEDTEAIRVDDTGLRVPRRRRVVNSTFP